MGAFLSSLFGPGAMGGVAQPVLSGITSLLGGLLGGAGGQPSSGPPAQIKVGPTPTIPQYTPDINSGYMNQPTQQNFELPMPPGYKQM